MAFRLWECLGNLERPYSRDDGVARLECARISRLYGVRENTNSMSERGPGRRALSILMPIVDRVSDAKPSPMVKRCLPANANTSCTACRWSFSSDRAGSSPASVSRARATTSSGVLNGLRVIAARSGAHSGSNRTSIRPPSLAVRPHLSHNGATNAGSQ